MERWERGMWRGKNVERLTWGRYRNKSSKWVGVRGETWGKGVIINFKDQTEKN